MKKLILYALTAVMVVLLMSSKCGEDPVDNTPPDTPADVLIGAGDEKAILSWTANTETDLAGYVVYWGTSADALDQSMTVAEEATSAEVTGLSNGTAYFVAVAAKDSANNISDATPPQSVTPVAPDTTAPTMTDSLPTNGGADVPVDAVMSVTFSEAMDTGSVTVTMSPELELGEAVWNEDNTMISFDPADDMPFGTAYTVEVSGSDPAGNLLAGTNSFAFTTVNVPDTTAPTVLTSTPADTATGIDSGTNLALTFSEAMDRASVEAAFSVSPDVPCVFLWSSDDTLVTCDPVSSLATSTTVTVTLAASATDKAANPLAAPFSYSFTTAAAPDTTAPTVTGSSPAASAQGISRTGNIKITFSEPMDKASVTAAFAITSPAGYNAGVTSWNADGTEMTFNPDATPNYGQVMRWQVSTTATDLAGNPLAANASETFRIVRQTTKKLYSVAELDGSVSNTSVVMTAPAFIIPDGLAGDLDDNTYRRGFLSFDLSELPANLVRINGASLYVRQGGVSGNAYSDLDKLRAESVNYGPALEASDFETPVLETRQCFFSGFPTLVYTCSDLPESRVLSDNANLEFKSTSATTKVQDDWANRSARGSRSQYRLKFEQNVTTDNAADLMWFYSGDAADNFKPYLEVTYEYP